MSLNFLLYISYILVFLVSFPVHEFAHAYVAKLLGDDSAQKKGRLTINPAQHFDLIGILCLFVLGFGWSKAVPINVNKFSNPKRDMALVGLAGPVSNLLLALFSLFFCKLFIVLKCVKIDAHFISYFIVIFQYFTIANLNLAVFNLIPIPPLDGSRLIMCFLPKNYYYATLFLEKFGSLFILILIFNSNFDSLISFFSGKILYAFDMLTSNMNVFSNIM